MLAEKKFHHKIRSKKKTGTSAIPTLRVIYKRFKPVNRINGVAKTTTLSSILNKNRRANDFSKELCTLVFL